MYTLETKTSQGPSLVKVGREVLQFLPEFLGKRSIFFLADSTLKQQAEFIQSLLRQTSSICHTHFLAANETSKSFEQAYQLYGTMLEAGVDRSWVLVALGGGVIGDLGGFLAGTFLRGIPWVGLPSTLLAQVDSCIGGKTGINHPRGKNLIGLFHHPKLVLCDVTLLETLPDREIISGLGEMIKYGLIRNAAFFEWLEHHLAKILSKDVSALETGIITCLQEKAAFVEQDEFDDNGTREFLNFGHTLGHALEAATNYSYFRHGEAVLWGMRAALYVSWKKGFLPKATYDRIQRLFQKIPLPNIPASLSFGTLLDAIKLDKKRSLGKVRFILLREVGFPFITSEVNPSELEAAFLSYSFSHT